MDLLERKRRQDIIQNEFNNYKRAGSTLLQAGRIDAKKYYANVRNKGIKLGLLTENDYPTDLPASIEPIMRIGGATIGAVLGGAAGLAGRQNPLTSASVGAGLGGAAATAGYRELAELLNPDLPLAPIGKKVSDAGMAGLIDFGGTLAVGGVFNALGVGLGNAAKISQRGAANLANKSPEELTKISDGIPKKVGFLQRMFTDKEKQLQGLVDTTVKEMQEQGLTPYMAAMSPELIKSYFQAAGVMPILGSPVQKLYTKQVNELVKRLVDGVKRDANLTKEPLLSPGAFVVKGNKIIRDPKNIPDELNNTRLGAAFIQNVEKNINQVVQAKKEAYKAFDKSIVNLKTPVPITQGNLRGTIDGQPSDVIANGKTLQEMIGVKGEAQTSFGIFARNNQFNESASAIKDMQNRYMKKNGKEYILRDVKFKADGTMSGANLNQLYANVRDSLGLLKKNTRGVGARAEPGDAGAIARLGSIKAGIEQTLKGAGDDGLAAFNQLESAKAIQRQLASDIEANIPALQTMGSQNMYNIVAKEAPEYSISGVNLAQKIPNSVTLGTVVKKYFDAPDVASQRYLKKILDEGSTDGLSSYKALVSQEMDDIFYKTVFAKTNRTGDFASTVPDFRKAMGIDGSGGNAMKARIQVAYGESAEKIINELPKIAKVMEQYMIKEPNMSNFVVRNAILSGSIGIGSIGLFGYSMGGVMGTAVSLGIMRSVTNFLAKPYSKELINTAIKRSGTPAGDAAGTRIMSELNEGTKSASKFNAYKEKVLSRVNPEAYRRLMITMQQAGIETTGQATGAFARPDEDILNPVGGIR
jgi:hypothetical protein